MLIVTSKTSDAFQLPEHLAKAWNVDPHTVDDDIRIDSELIEYALTEGYNDLQVTDIPDEATDWLVADCCGLETIFVCIDGKIYLY